MSRTVLFFALVLGCLIATDGRLVAGGEDKASAIREERKKYEGTWRVIFLQVNGKQAPDKDAKKLTVVNLADGTWSVLADGKEVMKGVSQIDPTKKLKTIDFTPTEGSSKGQVHLGIYEIKQNCRKLCFTGPGKDRPKEFSSKAGSEQVLVIFQREKP